MSSFSEKIKKAAIEAVVGILIGFLLNAFKENILALPNGTAWIAIIEILPILAFLKDIDIIHRIPVPSAVGYFSIIFTVGKLFMPDWEIGLNIILLIVYILKKITG